MRGALIPHWLRYITWRNLIRVLIVNEIRGIVMSAPGWVWVIDLWRDILA